MPRLDLYAEARRDSRLLRMPDKVLYTLRVVGGQLDRTVFRIVEAESGDTRIEAIELRADDSKRGGASLEEVGPQQGWS
jgi:hypothetical protein